MREKPPRVRYLPVAEGKRLHIEAYPCFHVSGSISGMRKHFYGEKAMLVRCGSYIYNVSAGSHGSDIYYAAH